jgi:hypothetical protein
VSLLPDGSGARDDGVADEGGFGAPSEERASNSCSASARADWNTFVSSGI